MNRDEIKYLALQELGYVEEPNFDDDNDNAVNAINNQYNHIYSLALQSFNWSFSERRAELNGLDNEDGEYKYMFMLPSDLLFLRAIYSNNVVVQNYKWTGEKLYANIDSLVIDYTVQVCEETLPAYFVDYLKYKLAKMLCHNLTGDNNLLQLMTNNEAIAFAQAKNIDLLQRPVRVVDTGAYVDVRY